MNIFSLATRAFIISFPLCFPFHLLAQDAPITWGEIPKADLEMKSYSLDTNASALILCDYGESNFDNDLHIIFNRHLRVKIFTTKGYDWGTESIILYTDEEDAERIYDIEGVTYFLNTDGSMEKKKLSKKDIYEEKADENHTRYRFTLPGLQPGCVIEIRYSIEATNPWFAKNWIFQHSEPVRWSEYRFRNPKAIAFSWVTGGYEPFTVNESVETNQVFSGSAKSRLGNSIVQCIQKRWAVKNLPGLRDEPYVTTLDDYYNRVYIQLAGYSFVGQKVQLVLNTWSNLVKELLDSKYFFKKIDDTRSVCKKTQEITIGLTTPEEKLNAIYNWVSESIVWTGKIRVETEEEVDDILDSKKGSNADITFLLLSMLKCAGISGEPVILSTRNNGKIQELYPILRQFNYVLARVTIDSKTYLLDATDPLRPMNLLPIQVLNVKGLVIKSDAVEWVRINSQKEYNLVSFASIKINEDGSLEGTFEDDYHNYAGMLIRSELNNKKDIDIAKEAFETEQTGINIDSVSIESKDSISLPLKLKASINASGYAQGNGDFIYINPHILHRTHENPFKKSTRNFPVDYSYKRSYNSDIKLTLPKDYEVKDCPIYRSFTLGQDLAIYTRNIQVDTHQVQILYKLEIRETEIKPSLYNELRDFYAQIVAIESEQLVLSKIKKPAAPVQTEFTKPIRAKSAQKNSKQREK